MCCRPIFTPKLPKFRATFVGVLALGLCLAARGTPLTVDKAIKLALENNQRMKVSTFSPQIARANLLAEYGRFDPELTFRRTYSEDETPGHIAPSLPRSFIQTDDYSISLDGLLPWGLSYGFGITAKNNRSSLNGLADNYLTFGGLSVTQPLLRGFGFGAALAGVRVAKASRKISVWQHRQVVIDTVTNVIFVFNNLQQARDNAGIARHSRDRAAQLLEENETRRRLGATSDAEVTQARARVANREESILIFERTVRDIENQLRQLIGDTAYLVDGPPLEIATLAPAPDISVDAREGVKKAFELRPDYQAARLGIAIDRTNYDSAQNQLLPRVDFVGSYGYSGADPNFRNARAQVRDQDARFYSIGVLVRVPLTFTEGRGRSRSAKLTLRQSEVELARIEQDIALAVAAAAGQIETAKRRVAATRLAFELATHALDNEQKRFKAGATSTFLVLQQQELLSSAQNSYARALADQRRAIANYHRELGTTLIHHNIILE
ncbi:MAG: TolC family protein [Opitutaceae bacterium]